MIFKMTEVLSGVYLHIAEMFYLLSYSLKLLCFHFSTRLRKVGQEISLWVYITNDIIKKLDNCLEYL